MLIRPILWHYFVKKLFSTFLNKQASWNNQVSELNSENISFNLSRETHYLEAFLVFISLFRQVPGCYFQLEHGRIPPHSPQLINYFKPVFRHCILGAFESIVN